MNTQPQNITTELADLRRAYEKSLTQNTELAISLQAARTRLQTQKSGELQPSPGTGNPNLTSLLAEREELQKKLQQHSAEITSLRRAIENMKHTHVVTGSDGGASARALPDVINYTLDLERSYQAVLSSTSWRLTGLLRAVIGKLKGHKYEKYSPKLQEILNQHGL